LTIVDLPIPDGPVITTNDSFLTSFNMVATAEVSKNLSFFQLSISCYHILPVMCPEDIVKYLDPNIKQIYIIDDICGKFSVDQSMINSWERVKCQILKYRKDNKKFRVLGTCRLQISNYL
jgi:hypothetical protein